MSKTGCALMGSTILGGHSAIEEIDWIAEGEAFGRDPSGERMWEVGKWWFRFDRVLTKRSRKQIIKSPGWSGPPYHTCRIAGQVFNHFCEERVVSQSWEKHRHAKVLPVGLAVLLLKEAERKGWGESRLYYEVARAQSPHHAATGPDIFASMGTIVASGRRYRHNLVDVPWRFTDRWNRYSGAERHYPTLSMNDILALPLPMLSADDAYLHLWCPSALAWYEGRELMDHWGFRCVGQLMWGKIDKNSQPQMGVGRYWRNAHEALYLGVRGHPPGFTDDIPSWFAAKRGAHSRKPEAVYSMIERAGPGPYLELFATRRRDGWDQCGNMLADPSQPTEKSDTSE